MNRSSGVQADMKRIIIISAFLFALVTGLPAKSNGDLSLTYRRTGSTGTLEVRLDTGSLIYNIRIRQQKDGRFLIQAPPFPVVHVKGLLRLGELKPSGKLALLLDPFSTSGGTSNFRTISEPSFSPVLSGMVLHLDKVDVFSLSPVFNPASPSGFGAMAQGNGFFAGFLFTSQNPRKAQAYSQPYQISWESSGLAGNLLLTIAGFDAKTTVYDFNISTSVFVRNSWDPYFGGGTTAGWELGIGTETAGLTLSRRLGGRGADIRKTAATDNPSDVFSFSLSACPDPAGLSFEVGYASSLYPKPVYGGESRRRLLEYTLVLRLGSSNLDIEHTTSFDTDRGKVSESRYILSLADDRILKDLKLEADVTVRRGAGPVSADGSVTLKAKNATLRVNNGKTYLELFLEKKEDGHTFRISVDQDRQISARLAFSGI